LLHQTNRKNLTINKHFPPMKNMKKIFVLIALLTVFAMSTFAQGTSATATSSATIITPIGISNSVALAYGNIAVNTTAGTVLLPATSGTPTRVASGGVTLPAVPGTVTAAKFTVTGQPGSAYSIGLPANGTVTITGAGTPMTVNTFTSSLSGNAGNTGTGSQDLYVGATLGVAGSQSAGTYTGTFTVTVNYN
jgi:hypothetical protein